MQGRSVFYAGGALAVALLLPAAAAFASDRVYKVVGSDGRVSYSDRAPTEGKPQSTLEFRSLLASPLSESVLRFCAQLEFRAEARARAAQVLHTSTPQLFTAPWCGYCAQAGDDLAARRVRFVEHDIDTADGMLAFIEAGGTKGVPLLLVGSRRVQGYSRGGYDRALRPR